MKWPLALAIALLASPAVADDVAVGVGTSWQIRRDFGSETRPTFVPELVGETYVATSNARLYLRPAVRAGFAGIVQAEMPMAIQIREYDISVLGELSVLYDAAIIPTLGVGAGATARWVRGRAEAPLAGDASRFDDFDLLPLVYGQIGAGVPFARGRLVIEPYARYELVIGDERIGWRLGLDTTFAW
ncbi:MAG: hypothetical protein KJO07_23900 [Deltaproteobacteria bacterium]|nr:hypothetical protein [Deltaproteobacteria bacterium]